MDWEFDTDRPIYAQLIERIEQAVVTGEYPPGSKMPGVRELAAEAGVNPNTMQRALAELEAKGLLHSQRTSGRFVTEDTARINDLRGDLAVGITRSYVGKMLALRCTQYDIEQYVSSASKELAREE